MKTNNKIILSIFVLIFLILFVTNNNQNTVEKPLTQESLPTVEHREQASTSETELKNRVGTSTDGVYTNAYYKFSIKYQPKIGVVCGIGEPWEYHESNAENYLFVSFGPQCAKSGGYIWGINLYKDRNVEEIIALSGKQFSDRKEVRKNITVNGVPSLLVTVTTGQVKDWIDKTVIIIKDDVVVTISNGAVDLPEFDDFYNSFVFTK